MPPDRIETGAVVAGGGPAGVMTGLLLARAGIGTVVLEKHADFLRDFRGDTIHPSSRTVLRELGLLDAFLERPHQKVRRVAVRIGGRDWPVGEFARLKRHPPYVALIPQWEFLDFLVGAARRWPRFRILMETEAEALVEDGGTVVGVHATGPEGPVEIRAPLTVAADGRHSRLREAA
ncbi:MAG TPA: FAD-dependent monooxygenase, partial [Thermohalobaculum sp.]|nr:FAD-dependent monooxygenase [Thermohalobaculum sp.]